MADLVLEWGALDPHGYTFSDTPADGVSATVDAGGVAVDITFTAQHQGAEAFTVTYPGYTPEASGVDPASHLKLFGTGGDGGAVSATSTTVFGFRATGDGYGDEVENLSFLLNDIDGGRGADLGDLGEYGRGGGGYSFEDIVTVLAYDAAGDPVEVTLTALGGGTGITGTTTRGEEVTRFADRDGTLQVDIAGPVSRIEILYANGGDAAQAVLISDMSFSTTGNDDGNLPPVANDDLYETATDTIITIDPTVNDSDPDGDPISVSEITDPEHGIATINEDGTVTYTPDGGFEGEDRFGYTIGDGNGGTDTGEIVIGVGGDTVPGNRPPVAVDDRVATDPDSPVTLDPVANDSDPDGDALRLSSVGEAFNGTVTRNADGTVTYTPDAGFGGTDSFAYTVGDGHGGTDIGLVTVEVPCFTPGTLIATPQGERPVEELREGDRVITRDNGIQEIRWIGSQTLNGHHLARKPQFVPVLIRKGALGNDLPLHDLLVSPNHRVLVANDRTALYFEEREVLAAAKHLTGLGGVEEAGMPGVTYVHFMFDRHEVVLSNGAWTESFQPGDFTLRGIDGAQREEILDLFPELEQEKGLRAYGAARRSLKKHEAMLLAR